MIPRAVKVDTLDFYRGQTVLVTGGTGFVGRHLVELLRPLCRQVRVPVHSRPLPLEWSDVLAIEADLTRPEDCRRVSRDVDCIFHAAGASAGAGVGPGAVMAGIATNVTLTARVLEAAWANGVSRCLVFSSSTVYPEMPHPAVEEDAWTGPPHESYFGYGWMRRYFECMGQFVAKQSPMRIAIVRPTAVYGRFDNFDVATSHLVPALIRKAVERQSPFEVWGTGRELRDLLHVTDLARGCLMALDRYACADPVNIGYGRAVAVGDLVRVVLDAAGLPGVVPQFKPSIRVGIPSRQVDCSKAARVLGFEPHVSLADGLRDTVEWYRSRPETSGSSRGAVP